MDFPNEPKGSAGRFTAIDLRLSRLHSFHSRKGLKIRNPVSASTGFYFGVPMRLSILDYSQKAAVDMVDTVKGKDGKEKTIRVDTTDLLILRWFSDFYPKMLKRVIDGKEYGWVKRSKVLDDLPILGISEASVSDRLRKLVHFGLLDYKLVKEDGTYCYYRHGKNYDLMVSGQTNDGEGSNLHGVYGQPHVVVSGQTHNKDSHLKDSPIKDNGFAKNGKNPSSPCPKCGGKLFKNTQTGWIECSQCFERF